MDTANQLQIRQPLAGQTWYAGQTRFIQWSFQEATPDAVITILLQEKNNVATPTVIAYQIPAIPGTQNILGHRWVVPRGLKRSRQYLIRLVAQYTTADNKPPVSAIGPKFTISS